MKTQNPALSLSNGLVAQAAERELARLCPVSPSASRLRASGIRPLHLPLLSLNSPVLSYVRERPDMAIHLPALRHGLSNRFKVQVLDGRTKKVLRETKWAPNLILDQGLNTVMGGATTNAPSYQSIACAVGTGTAPVEFDSGTITATAAGTNVTSSAGFFTAGMVGMLLKFNSGAERYITAFNSSTSVDVNASVTAGPEEFTVWAVNQTSLGSESKRTNTYLTGAGNCGTSIVAQVTIYKRTYDFAVEVANQNYTELGWSQTTSAGANLFSRALITGGSVSVLIGQQLRVIYELSMGYGQKTPTAATAAIAGWPVAPAVTTDGDYMNCNPISEPGNVDTNGNATTGSTTLLAQPDWRLTTGTVFPSFGADYSEGSNLGTATSLSLDSYVSGSFSRTKNANWNLTTGNSTAIRGIFQNSGSGRSMALFIFDEAQTKANTHTLALSWPVTLARILTNF